MAEWHLIDLRNALHRKKWQLFTCLKGNDYDISEIWQIQRPDGTEKLHIEFDGLDDLETLPLEASYGCKKVRDAAQESKNNKGSCIVFRTHGQDTNSRKQHMRLR